MKLSTIVAKVENAVIATGRGAKHLALSTKDRIGNRVEDVKLAALASQIQDSRQRLSQLSDEEKHVVNVMTTEIQMVRDMAIIRRNERRLRRELARKIKNGDISLRTVETYADEQGLSHE